MSAASALAYLVLASFRGRMRQLARRVRSPRHFFGMLLAAAWIAYAVASNASGVRRATERHGPLDVAWAVELVALFAFSFALASSWVVVPAGAGLGFTEAEAQLLFPTPLRRRQLVGYKLAQSALGALVVAVLATAVFGRGGVGQRAMSAAAGWIALMTVTLHGAGATLTRASLAQHGVSGVRRRVLTLAVAAAVPLAVAVGWWRAPPLEAFRGGIAGRDEWLDAVAGTFEWTRALAGTAPLSWVLYPLRAALDAAFAPGAGAFWAALPGAAVVLLLHLAWVYSSDAAFEEAALEHSRKAAARRDQLSRSGALTFAASGRRRRSFALGANGRPEAALAWKALVRGTRAVSIPLVVSAATLGLSAAIALLVVRDDGGPGQATMVAIFAFLFWAMTSLLGPFVFSGDLRRDAAHLELLRALPLRGRQVLGGELAVPLAQTALVQWLLVAIWWAASPFPESGVERVASALAAAIAGPAISLPGFLVANGLVVLYPDWAGRPAAGSSPLEGFGARNLLGVVTFVFAAVALTPAALAGAIVGWAAWPVLGIWAVPLGAAAGAAGVVAGAALALRLLGRAFERVDLSD